MSIKTGADPSFRSIYHRRSDVCQSVICFLSLPRTAGLPALVEWHLPSRCRKNSSGEGGTGGDHHRKVAQYGCAWQTPNKASPLRGFAICFRKLAREARGPTDRNGGSTPCEGLGNRAYGCSWYPDQPSRAVFRRWWSPGCKRATWALENPGDWGIRSNWGREILHRQLRHPLGP